MPKMMTVGQYNKTRVNKKRLEATDAGKEAIKIFVESIIKRNKVEHKEYNFKKGSDNWIITMYFYFTKYLVERYLENDKKINSRIFVMFKTKNDTKFTHNILAGGEWMVESAIKEMDQVRDKLLAK